ncbi:MAG TPA: hypothetical protein PKZ75_13370 [Bacteroidia bacterium]|nr:hypothetical protein [Bacteroidia bacterium]
MKNHFAKIFIVFVSIVYVMSTIGISVFSHYCGGELEEVALFSKPTSCCGEDEADMDDGCCKNEISHIAFQKDFTFYQLIKDCKAPVLVLAIFNFQNSIFNFNGTLESLMTVNKEFPPPKLVQSEIVSCSVLRI